MIDEICQGIAQVADGIEGIKAVHTVIPEKMDTAELPALYPVVGNASYDWRTEGPEIGIVTRTIELHVAVMPYGTGGENELEKAARALIEPVVNAFSNAITLGGVTAVQLSEVRSDTGPIRLPEFGLKYVGFIVPLSIAYLINRELKDW